MKALWYRACHWLVARLYFERIAVVHPGRLPAPGPTLYVVLHRNGAVDGVVYRQVLPRAVPVISTQLRRSFFARLFFCGIAVARRQDPEDGRSNAEALRECVDRLAGGGEILIFPEGTSALGPRHLPFKSGAARLALDALARGVPLRIVPLGIHYERAWGFRSRVEAVVGEPVATEFPSGLGEPGRMGEMKARVRVALEAVGVNFHSVEAQELAERIANTAVFEPSGSYFGTLKALERGVPEPLSAEWRNLAAALAGRRVLRFQGVPLFPATSWFLDAGWLLFLGPVVLSGALANLPPLLLGWIAGRCLADGPNVIALWRLLVGLPVFVLWTGAVVLGLGGLAGWWWGLGHVALTVAALQALYGVKKRTVAVWNGMAHRDLVPRARAWRDRVRRTASPTRDEGLTP